jgi:hypothetical protein
MEGRPVTSVRARGARRSWSRWADRVIGALALLAMLVIWIAALAPCTLWLLISLAFRGEPDQGSGALRPAQRTR